MELVIDLSILFNLCYNNNELIHFKGSGSHMGLTVLVNVNLDEYHCSTTNSAGFKVIHIETFKRLL